MSEQEAECLVATLHLVHRVAASSTPAPTGCSGLWRRGHSKNKPNGSAPRTCARCSVIRKNAAIAAKPISVQFEVERTHELSNSMDEPFIAAYSRVRRECAHRWWNQPGDHIADCLPMNSTVGMGSNSLQSALSWRSRAPRLTPSSAAATIVRAAWGSRDPSSRMAGPRGRAGGPRRPERCRG
jgi:hypothetical protein